MILKIVQLVTRMDEPGGAQIHVRDLSLALNRLGHDVHLLSGSIYPVFKEIDQSQISYHYIKNLIRNIHPLKDLKAFMEIRAYIKRVGPDLVAVHSSKAGLIGRLAGRSLGVPTVFTAHGWAFTDGVSTKKRILYSILEKVAAKISSGIITVSHYDQNLALKNRIAPAGKIKVIHNGVIDGDSSVRSVLDLQPPKLVMVARFAEPKNHPSLIKVLNEIRDYQWQMVFIGDGPLREKSEELVKNLGLSDRVIFLGNRSDVQELLSSYQIFVLMSKWEGLPLSILEAMRSGLPVVAANVGGVSETIIDGYNGYLIPNGQPAELVEKLLILITNPALRVKMGHNARQRYQEHFTFEKMFDETLSFYQKILRETKKSRREVE